MNDNENIRESIEKLLESAEERELNIILAFIRSLVLE